MAGAWIKMRSSLLSDPKVNGIARILEQSPAVCRVMSHGRDGVMRDVVTRNVMRHVTVASLVTLWSDASNNTRDGVYRNYDLSDIDDLVGIPGFGLALEAVGWAEFDAAECTVTLPNFAEYNVCSQIRGASAKSGAQRQREYRERKKAERLRNESDVTRYVTGDVTSDPRVDKSRKEPSPDGEGERARNAHAKTPPPPANAPSPDTVAASSPEPPPPAGTALPADWALPDAWLEWAEAERPGLGASKIRLTAEKFAEHWHARQGAAALCADWFVAWQEFFHQQRPPGGKARVLPIGAARGKRPPAGAATSPEQRFAMHDAWVPSPRGWPATVTRNALSGVTLTNDQLLEFRSYWINRPDTARSQGQWEHELAKSMKRDLRKAQASGGTDGPSGRVDAKRVPSVADILTDDNW
ncbi:DnaT-like ssDNA-binding domain-containing protein [Pseudomonas schmalbachii]|uniref:DnaT DNA-binding domain-containing protein n=1 Tax=Pseudomonas schmalbachii TaxID=2816993 RepID=A0ABS3TKI6_9PSED|nr:DnaT-like ssDNA-binding domain-containing protein [Pseudomonas schmalbachii]MBO3274147.1 hypothetical protein [Pseudomonas schmalbachii]